MKTSKASMAMLFPLAFILFSIGCGSSSRNSTQPTSASCLTSADDKVPVPQSTCAYFGAYVNPTGGTGTSGEVVTEALETQLGRTLALHMQYVAWGTPGTTVANSVPSFPNGITTNDTNAGRIPVISWTCGNLNTIVATASPTVDVPDYNLIVATAQAVKTYGKPIFLRFDWEMNFSNPAHCMGTGNIASKAAGFIAAWQNIYNIFAAQGVTNVSWLWNPGGAVTDPDAAPFYPGNAYVDWIGFDGYDKNNANDFGVVFNSFYQEFVSNGKPFLIGETGECPGLQSQYLKDATTEIASRPNTGNYSFPQVKGFMYFDAPGSSTCTWTFDADGTSGFATMGADPFFQTK
jgi:hypothetical protein